MAHAVEGAANQWVSAPKEADFSLLGVLGDFQVGGEPAVRVSTSIPGVPLNPSSQVEGSVNSMMSGTMSRTRRCGRENQRIGAPGEHFGELATERGVAVVATDLHAVMRLVDDDHVVGRAFQVYEDFLLLQEINGREPKRDVVKRYRAKFGAAPHLFQRLPVN
jgi:hypothetical protein